MAYGDVNYTWVQAGSTATSAAGLHNFFGVYDGLSDLNAGQVLHLQVTMTGDDAYLGPSSIQVSNNFGVKVGPAGSLTDFPPMKRDILETFQFSRVSSTDASANWTVWARNP